jgi:hypothetical protein
VDKTRASSSKIKALAEALVERGNERSEREEEEDWRKRKAHIFPPLILFGLKIYSERRQSITL